MTNPISANKTPPQEMTCFVREVSASSVARFTWLNSGSLNGCRIHCPSSIPLSHILLASGPSEYSQGIRLDRLSSIDSLRKPQHVTYRTIWRQR